MRRSVLVSAVLAAVSFAVPTVARADALVGASPNCTAGFGGFSNFSGTLGCFGSYLGNERQSVSEIQTLLAGGGFLTGAIQNSKSDQPNNGLFGTVVNGTSGTITFDTPISGNFAILLKAGNQFSIYTFTGAVNETGFTYSTAGVNTTAQGGQNELSHATLYTGGQTVLTQCVGAQCITSVPEPSTYALMGAGLLAVGFVARRRRNNA